MARRVHTSTALQDRCKIAARCGVLRREQGLALGVRTATETSRTLRCTCGPALASAASAVGSALSLASASTRCRRPSCRKTWVWKLGLSEYVLERMDLLTNLDIACVVCVKTPVPYRSPAGPHGDLH